MKRGTKITIGVLLGLMAIVVALRVSITSVRVELLPPEGQPPGETSKPQSSELR